VNGEMKKLSLILLLFCFTVILSGCATIYPVGSFYTGVKVPSLMGDGQDVSYSKVGKAKAISILSLFAFGDASIEKAKQNGNIKTIKYIDWKADNILGIYGEYTTIVYGD
jgi:hypothetical protein